MKAQNIFPKIFFFVLIFCVGTNSLFATIEISEVQPASIGACDGHITTLIEGSAGPFRVSLYLVIGTNPTLLQSHGAINGELTFSNLCPGDYSIKVTGQTDCKVNLEITLEECAEIMIPHEPNITPPSDCQSTNGKIRFLSTNLPSGGTPPYSYLWNTGDTDLILFELSAGTYTLTVTDALGCTGAFSYLLEGEEQPVIDIEFDPACSGQNNGNLSVAAFTPGSSTLYDFFWSTGYSSFNTFGSDLTDLAAGIYTVTISEVGGVCEFVEEIEIPEINPDGPIIISGIINPDCATAPGTGSVRTQVSGGNPPYRFHWGPTPGLSGSGNISNQESGIYCLTVTDYCSGMTSECFEITTGSFSPIEIKGDLHPGNTRGDIELFVSGGDGAYSFEWSTGHDGAYLSDVTSAVYTVTVTDGTGCYQSKSFDLANCGPTLPPLLPLAPFVVEVLQSEEAYEAYIASGGESLPPSREKCDGSDTQIIISEISGSRGPYTIIIEAETGYNAGTVYYNQTVSGNQSHYEFPVTRTGRYLVKVYDNCGNEIIRHVDVCEYCGYEYLPEKNRYVLFEGALIFDLNCKCPSDCQKLGLFDKNVKITAKVQKHVFVQQYYVVTWPDGSKVTFDKDSGKETYNFEENTPANQVFYITVYRVDDGCEVTFPISLMAGGTESVLLDNGRFDEEDFYIASRECEVCKPIQSYYDREDSGCLIASSATDFTYIPYDFNNPCTGGGRFWSHKIIDGNIEYSYFVVPPFINLPVPDGVSCNGSIPTGFACESDDFGCCVFSTLDIYGVALDRDILVHYCESYIPFVPGGDFPDADDDGIPDEADMCPNNPDPFCADPNSDGDGDGIPDEDEGEYYNDCEEVTYELDSGCDIRVYLKCEDGTSELINQFDGPTVTPCRFRSVPTGECLSVRAYCVAACHWEVINSYETDPRKKTTYLESDFSCDDVTIQFCDELMISSGCTPGFNPNEPSSEVRNQKIKKRKKEKEKESYSIYPNPFTNSFTILVNHPNQSYSTQLYLLNNLGEIILQDEFNTTIGDNTKYVGQLSNLPKGMYTLILFNKEEILLTHKLVKVD